SVGNGPSDITFANVIGQDRPDIVVSNQISGDFSVLLTEPTPSLSAFSQQYRYRAGTGLFDIDDRTGKPTVLSALQTVAIAAGDFTGSGNADLILVNQGAKSFTLLLNQGQRGFINPQPNNSYVTSDRPSQVVTFTFPGDHLESVAIL